MNQQTVLTNVRQGLGLTLLLGMLSGTALAQSTQAPHEMLELAWQEAEETLGGVLTPRQNAQLNDLAHAAAVDSLCEGFNVDADKFKAEFQQLAPEEGESMSAEEMDYFKQHLLVNYGLVVGLFLSEGALDQEGFCRAAEEARNDPEVAHLWQ